MTAPLDKRIANIKQNTVDRLKEIAASIDEDGGDALVFLSYVLDAANDGVDEAFAEPPAVDVVWPVRPASTVVYDTARA